MRKLFLFVIAILCLSFLNYASAYSSNEAGIGNSDDAYLLILAQDTNNPLTKDNTMLVDTRSKELFDAEHVKGAVNMSLDTLKQNFENGAFNGKNLFLLYNGGSKGGVSMTGLNMIGAIVSVVLYFMNVPGAIINDMIAFVLEGFLNIKVDYESPMGLPGLYSGNLLGLEKNSINRGKKCYSKQAMCDVISAADEAGFKGIALPLSALKNALLESK